MKTLTLILGCLIFLLGFYGCKKGGLFCHRGKGSFIEETRDIGRPFNSVNLSLGAALYISQKASDSLMIEAQENIIDIIKTEIRSNTLTIGTERGRCIRDHDGIRVYAASENIAGLNISGSGLIVNETPIITNDLDLKISGSGTIELDDLSAKTLEANISGSGKISLEGPDTSDFIDARISGSGNMKFFGFVTSKAEIQISGSGDCEIYALDELIVNISGSGNVYYKGNPKITVHTSGSGDVIRKN